MCNQAALAGRKVRLTFNSCLQTVTFSAVILKENSDGTVTVKIPDRIRATRWSPWTGSAYRFSRAAASKALVN
jgi:hypothetical protein